MSLHPDYAATVQTALQSDIYWANGLELLPLPFSRPNLSDESALHRVTSDPQYAAHIGSVVSSIFDGGSFEELALGDPLPQPHERQVLRIIEDSRAEGRSILPMSGRRVARVDSTLKAVEKIIQREVPDYKNPSFEDVLGGIHNPRQLVSIYALKVVQKDKFTVTRIARGIRYLIYDEPSGKFITMPAHAIGLEPERSAHLLRLAQIEKVGDIYRVIGSNNMLGRVVSAGVYEATNVTWKTPKKPGNKKKKLQLPLSHAGLRGVQAST